MKKFLTIALMFAAVVSCQKNQELTAEGEGGMKLDFTASSRVASTAAEGQQTGYEIKVPELGEFRLTITGADFNQTWSSLADYSVDGQSYPKGDYTVAIQYGEPTDEGFEKPYFFESRDVVVKDRNQTTYVDIEARLANSIVEVVMTDNFKGYFVQHGFTLTSAAGNEYTLVESPAQDLYVPAGSTVTVKCSAVRQADAATGKVTELSKSVTTKACTRHIIKYDLQKAGSVKVNITFDDKLIATETIDVELNENA